MTLNLGLPLRARHKIWNEDRKNDGTYYPRVLPFVNFASRGDNNNWSPRLGIAWESERRQNVVRAGYGRLFNTIMNGTPGAETTTLLQTSISINNPTYPDPYGGRTPASFASTAPPNISIVDDGMVNPYSDMFNVGFSHQLGGDMAINVDGVYIKSNAFNASVNINTPLQSSPGIAATPIVGRVLHGATSRRCSRSVSRTIARCCCAWRSGSHTAIIHGVVYAGEGDGQFVRRHVYRNGDGCLSPGVGPGLRQRGPPPYVCRQRRIPAARRRDSRHVVDAPQNAPFTARAGRDLNDDGATTDFVPGTTKGIGNRDNDAMMKAVNAYRAANGLSPHHVDQQQQHLQPCSTSGQPRRSRCRSEAGRIHRAGVQSVRPQ